MLPILLAQPRCKGDIPGQPAQVTGAAPAGVNGLDMTAEVGKTAAAALVNRRTSGSTAA
ncbi:MAG: hypothetical protein R3E79_62265 [Caldilineaceae bacterium]